MIVATGTILYLSLGLLLLGAAVSMIRLFLGPTVLDRTISVDVIAAAVIGIVLILVAWRGRTDLMVLMIIFALTAFFSSVTVARFAAAPSARQTKKMEQPVDVVDAEVETDVVAEPAEKLSSAADATQGRGEDK